MPQRFFRTLDTNHDGEIDPDEITHYETVIAPSGLTGNEVGCRPFRPALDPRAGRLGRHQLQPRRLAPTNSGQAARSRFELLDANHTGRLTLSQLRGHSAGGRVGLAAWAAGTTFQPTVEPSPEQARCHLSALIASRPSSSSRSSRPPRCGSRSRERPDHRHRPCLGAVHQPDGRAVPRPHGERRHARRWFSQADRNRDGVADARRDAGRCRPLLRDARQRPRRRDRSGRARSITNGRSRPTSRSCRRGSELRARSAKTRGQAKPTSDRDEARAAGAPRSLDDGLQGAARYGLLNIPEPVAAADANFNRGDHA